MATMQERAELHKTIWKIANDLRGSVDGWEFKAYVLGSIFYRFISENICEMISFPLPSLQDQHRIVSILDTFEASIQNLEAQLKQREKQYEYYRNKLLTFE